MSSTRAHTNNQPQGTSTLQSIANLLSYVLHPVFMPLLITFVMYKLAPASFAGYTQKQIGLWFASIGFTMVFFPLFTMLLLKGLGFLKSFKMESTKDRIVPLMATMIFYFWASHVFNNIPSPNLIKILLMGCFWGTIVLFMLNIFVKVSLHTSAAGGAVAWNLSAADRRAAHAMDSIRRSHPPHRVCRNSWPAASQTHPHHAGRQGRLAW